MTQSPQPISPRHNATMQAIASEYRLRLSEINIKLEKLDEKRETMAYTLPSIWEERWKQVAEQSYQQFGVRPIWPEPIPDPVVRKFMYDAMKGMRKADNPMHWGGLEDEEWDS